MRRGSEVGGSADGKPRAARSGATATLTGGVESGAIVTCAARGARVRGASLAPAAAEAPLWSCPQGEGRAPTREPGVCA